LLTWLGINWNSTPTTIAGTWTPGILTIRKSICLLLLAGLHVLPAQEQPTLAVLEFEGFGLSESEMQALTNRLRTNLTQLGVYRIIERGMMLQILMEQDFQMTGCTSDECAVEVGQLLGAQFMLAGSIGKVGNTWTVEMRIIDVQTGAVTKSASYDTQGTIDQVLVEGMSAAARKIAGVAAPVGAPTTATVALRPALLDVFTSPPGAVIFANDIDKGISPVNRMELPPGVNHSISARMDRYYPLDTTLALESGERERLDLQLQPVLGWLAFDGDAGSRVRVDGDMVGILPVENVRIQMGAYGIKAAKPGYYTFKSQAVVAENHTTTIDYTLKPKPKAPALIFSSVLPGSGQLYHGYKRGILYLAASLGLGYLGFTAHVDYLDERDNYETLLTDYNSETDIESALQKKAAVEESFDLCKELEMQRYLFFGGLGGVWLVNIIDVAF
jgi:TolB-like protein